MARPSRATASPYTTETVWNAGLSATGAAGEGRSLVIGHEGEWAPEHLLLLAAESCFMSTLLGLARDEGVEVLGYVSNGQLHVPRDPLAPLTMLLTPCIVVLTDKDAERIRTLALRAKERSVVARSLGECLSVALDVRAVPAATS